MRPALISAFALLVSCTTVIAQDKTPLEMRSGIINPGLPLPEKDKAVHGIRLTAQVDKAGDGGGTLELDSTVPKYDQFGYAKFGDAGPPLKLECTLKFAKKGKVSVPVENRVGGPEKDVEWLVYEVKGPKITSRLTLALTPSDKWSGRLLVHDKDGNVQYVIAVHDPGPPPPCHPGCFPAGTAIHVPGGTKAVDQIRAGDVVTTVTAEGKASAAKVAAVFVTKNRLLQVRTDAGDLLTTETQPLALVAGGLRTAGELAAGDRIFRWDGRERVPTTVRSVEPTGRMETVFNLVLGDPTVFVANGFLARSKPPAPVEK